jgi:hypothetical protein
MLYLFNGDQPEIVTVEDQGHFIKQQVYPHSVAWHGIRSEK